MKKSTFLGCLLLVLAIVGRAQTQFWSDTFEDTNAPSSGTRNPENTGGISNIPYASYFIRTNSVSISTNPLYTNFQGNKFWAGETTLPFLVRVKRSNKLIIPESIFPVK